MYHFAYNPLADFKKVLIDRLPQNNVLNHWAFREDLMGAPLRKGVVFKQIELNLDNLLLTLLFVTSTIGYSSYAIRSFFCTQKEEPKQIVLPKKTPKEVPTKEPSAHGDT
ncbi:Oidioi.mRNA.OKI2018_I69.chr1.g1964.t1.cds [Oikopleura dioica]|uniref:Oidioi.mRNA.OKI2018_I69.chr1.g1964.t1.cds n=1 Tax=Oikopleura dioica TaxID=34765 RepID=A0ABN7SPL7_OIKDI|nr:Oidioi.mRNA.OKI2018_I69.chr1.g1964.t1.cds [Oikopleura dioica]